MSTKPTLSQIWDAIMAREIVNEQARIKLFRTPSDSNRAAAALEESIKTKHQDQGSAARL